MNQVRAGVFVGLVLGSLSPACSGCVSFPETTFDSTSDTDATSVPDTGTDMGSSSATQGGTDGTGSSETSDTEDSETTSATLSVCPEGLMFPSEPMFTQIATCKSSGEGTRYLDACPNHQVLVGFRGFLGYVPNTTQDYHIRLQAICGTLSFEIEAEQCRVHVPEGSTLPERGLGGTMEWERRCPTDEVLVGFFAKTGSNIDQLIFFCSPVFIQLLETRHSIVRGPSFELPPAGKGGGSLNFGPLECPEDTLATVAHIEATTSVISFGLGCQTPSTVQ
jgi:hypothetical protein